MAVGLGERDSDQYGILLIPTALEAAQRDAGGGLSRFRS
jgi:hypothetical protein